MAETELRVNAKAQGFAQAQQQISAAVTAAQKATQAQVKGFAALESGGRRYRKEIAALEKQLKDLGKQQLATTKALEGTEKGTKIYAVLTRQVQDLNKEYAKTSTIKQRMQTLFGKQKDQGLLTPEDLARGGFMQGLMQGAIPSVFAQMQRGPGMWRQAMGTSLGTFGRGVVQAPFGGVEGMQQAFAGIPVVGGFAAGQLGTTMGFGAGALDVQRQRLGALPFFGGPGGVGQRLRGAHARGVASVQEAGYLGGGARFWTPDEISAQAGQAGNRAANATMYRTPEIKAKIEKEYEASVNALVARRVQEAAGGRELPEKTRALMTSNLRGRLKYDPKLLERLRGSAEYSVYQGEQSEKRATEETRVRSIMEEPQRRFEKDRELAGRRAAEQERRQPFAEVRRLGQRLAGLSEQEAIQAILPMLSRGGGTAEEARRQGMVGATFAAQTAYGVGPETSGAFLMGGRRGAMVGAQGRGGETLAETIRAAKEMGLQGSELTDLVGQIAQGVETWKTTGMPINPKSVTALSSAFAGFGLGGLRGSVTGQQFGQAAQRISQTGIQTPVDLLMLQSAGGYQGGGMDAYIEAQKRMEAMGGPGGLGGKDAQEIIQKLYQAGGGGGTGTWAVKTGLEGLGVKMGWRESELVSRQAAAPENLTAADKADLAKFEAERKAGTAGAPQGVAGLEAEALDAMKAYGGAVARAASLQNRQNDLGAVLLPSLQKLQASTININDAFEVLSKDGLSNASTKILAFTEAVDAFTKTMVGENGVLTKLSHWASTSW